MNARAKSSQNHGSHDVYERLGGLEARFDSVEGAMGRIEEALSRPFSGPSWVQIASLMLAGGIALAALLATYISAVTVPISQDAQLALESSLKYANAIGSLSQQVETLDREAQGQEKRISGIAELEGRNSNTINDINGRLSVYERWDFRSGGKE